MLRRRSLGVFGVVAVFSLVGLVSATAAGANPANGGGGLAGDPPIVPGTGWFPTTVTPPAFFWSGLGPVFSASGPFTFSSGAPAVVSVTDDFLCGDQFRIFDNNQPIGDTTPVPAQSCPERGPVVAYGDPRYSHGSFLVPAGSHSITIQVITNPFEAGRGYIRVDVCTAVGAGAFVGTSGNDVLCGSGGPDEMAGSDGDDLLFGFGGDDSLGGGGGGDVIFAGPGNDALSGGPGADILYGDLGNDRLAGGDGNDQLFGGGGTDFLDGGPGTDTCEAGTSVVNCP